MIIVTVPSPSKLNLLKNKIAHFIIDLNIDIKTNALRDTLTSCFPPDPSYGSIVKPHDLGVRPISGAFWTYHFRS